MTNLPASALSVAYDSSRAGMLRRALDRVFDVPFEVFERDDAVPTRLSSAAAERFATWAAAVQAPVAESWPDLLVDPTMPAAHDLPGGRLLLAVPIPPGEEWRGDETAAQVAVGIVAGRSADLAVRLAGSAFDLADYWRENQELQSHLDDFANQVTANFEEMTWLRELAGFLEICDLRSGLTDVAAEALPRLREIVGAEAVGLYVVASPAAAMTAGPNCVFWTGGGEVCPADGTAVIQSLRPTRPRPVVRNHLHADDAAAIAGTPTNVDSCIILPLARKGRVHGWLLAVNRVPPGDGPGQVHRLGDDEFGTVEAGLMGSAAVMLATHAGNVELFRDNEALTVGAIRTLINAIEAKDDYTRGHSDRVAALAALIGGGLGLTPAACARLRVTGLLHDIGKIGVPDAVLGKPGRLTDDEFEQIKRHPRHGYEILRHLRKLDYALPGVLHHHESFDGTGYPDRLVGEAIPLEARILAVADAYDAMTSTRPYRDGMPFEKAEAILRDGAGRQWDAAVLAAFFTVLDAVREVCRRDERLSAPDRDAPDLLTTLCGTATA